MVDNSNSYTDNTRITSDEYVLMNVNSDAVRKLKRDNSFDGEGLRVSFKDSLGKLIQISTREQAIKELKTIVLQNKTTSNLRIFLSVLSQNRQKHIESQINILAFIVQQYGRGLLDPLDKIPSLEKTVFRITELLIKYFSQETQNVSIACQRTWIQLYVSVLADEDVEMKKKLLYNNLQAILNGGADKISQTTAQFALDGLLETALNRQDNIFFKEIAKRALVLFLKTTIYHSSVLTCLQTVLGFFNIMNLLPLAGQIITKILFYVGNAANNAQGYKIRAQACNCLSVIGEQIDANGLQIYARIIKVLENLATDKVWAVQVTGRKALSIWRKNKKQWDDEFKAKNEQFYQGQQFYEAQVEDVSEYMPPPKKWDKQEYFDNSTNHPRENNWIQEPQKHYPTHNNFYPKKEEPPISSMPKSSQNWNNAKKEPSEYKFIDGNRNSGNYLHKNTGIGGGNTVMSVEQYYDRQKPQETYSKKMDEIKKSIYNAKDNYTEYDETIPWQEGKNLPAVSKTMHQQQWAERNSIPEEPLSQENHADAEFLMIWEDIVELSEQGKKEDAVKKLLEMDDDLYFLRYLLKYGRGLLAQLTRATSSRVLKHMLQIKKTNFMEQSLFKLVGESAKGGVGQLLTNQQNLVIVNKLQNCSKIAGLQKIAVKLKNLYEKSLQ